MELKGADAAPLEMANIAGRGLYAGEELRPGGRSDLAYMQHKYTPLDSRIIIITAAILLLLLAILFLNFFIRWALQRFFLLRSQKPINPNKGLSKRQVQALPSFIYSSSKPPPCHIFASPPCAHPNFYGDTLKPISCHSLTPTKIEVPKEDHNPPSQLLSTQVDDVDCHPPTKIEVPKCDHNSPSLLVSTQVVDVDSDPPSKLGSLQVDKVIAGYHSPTEKLEVVKSANSIISSTKTNVHTIHYEVKGNSPTFKGGHHIIDCTKVDCMASRGHDNASSSSPCPICLVDFTDGDTVRVLPACRHYFHIGCIDLWLAKSSSCPACRANILEATGTEPTLQVQVVATNSL